MVTGMIPDRAGFILPSRPEMPVNAGCGASRFCRGI